MCRLWQVIACVLMLLTPLTGAAQSADDEAIHNLASELAKGVRAARVKTVAVWDLSDLDGRTTKLGRYVAEELSVELATDSGNSFAVMDRQHVHRVLTELNLLGDKPMDNKTSRQLRRLAGVDALVTGTITELGTGFRVTAKVLNTETATIVAAGTCALGSDLRSLLVQADSPTLSDPSSATTHERDFLALTVTKITAMRDGQVLLIGTLRNSGPVALEVSLDSRTSFLMCDDNVRHRLDESTGVPSRSSDELDLGAGASTPVTVTFSAGSGHPRGKVGSVNLGGMDIGGGYVVTHKEFMAQLGFVVRSNGERKSRVDMVLPALKSSGR